jgi:MraZ protein
LAFRGTYDHSLDAKHRLTVPAKWRASLADGVLLAEGPDGCVTVWVPEAYEAFVAEAVGDEPRLSPRRRHLERQFHGASFDTELDSAGRIGIPLQHRQYGGLQKECKVVGAGDHFEVWDPEAWTAYSERVRSGELSDLFG